MPVAPPVHDALPPTFRRFTLVRHEDVHDFSGTGPVVHGCQWPDGSVAYRWNSAMATTVIARSIEDVVAIHGHDGRTVLVWVDDCPHGPGCGHPGGSA
jgi:hypothetical protein